MGRFDEVNAEARRLAAMGPQDVPVIRAVRSVELWPGRLGEREVWACAYCGVTIPDAEDGDDGRARLGSRAWHPEGDTWWPGDGHRRRRAPLARLTEPSLEEPWVVAYPLRIRCPRCHRVNMVDAPTRPPT